MMCTHAAIVVDATRSVSPPTAYADSEHEANPRLNTSVVADGSQICGRYSPETRSAN